MSRSWACASPAPFRSACCGRQSSRRWSCQPTLPINLFSRVGWFTDESGLGLSDEDVTAAKTQSTAPILGIRYTGDWRCPPERFARLTDELVIDFSVWIWPTSITRPSRSTAALRPSTRSSRSSEVRASRIGYACPHVSPTIARQLPGPCARDADGAMHGPASRQGPMMRTLHIAPLALTLLLPSTDAIAQGPGDEPLALVVPAPGIVQTPATAPAPDNPWARRPACASLFLRAIGSSRPSSGPVTGSRTGCSRTARCSAPRAEHSSRRFATPTRSRATRSGSDSVAASPRARSRAPPPISAA